MQQKPRHLSPAPQHLLPAPSHAAHTSTPFACPSTPPACRSHPQHPPCRLLPAPLTYSTRLETPLACLPDPPLQVSMVFAYPFTIQHVREAIPRSAWRSVTIRTRAFLTSALFVAVFVANTLLVSLVSSLGSTTVLGGQGYSVRTSTAYAHHPVVGRQFIGRRFCMRTWDFQLKQHLRPSTDTLSFS